MNVRAILENSGQYSSQRISISGFLHIFGDMTDLTLFIADRPIPAFDPSIALPTTWQDYLDSSLNVFDKKELIQQLYAVLGHKSVGVDSTLIKAHIDEQFKHQYSFMSLFEGINSGWENIVSPFIDENVEKDALDLYKLIRWRPIDPIKIRWTLNNSRFQTPGTDVGNCWYLNEIEGNLHNGKIVPVTASLRATKIIVQAPEFDGYLVIGDRYHFLENFGAEAISVREVLQNPHNYLNQRITIRGFYAGGVNFNFQQGIEGIVSYSRIVPNHLYYQFRGAWDNRVSLHMKSQIASKVLYSFYEDIPGILNRHASSFQKNYRFNHGSSVKITCTLRAPENEYSSYLMEDVTALTILHKDVLYDWKL